MASWWGFPFGPIFTIAARITNFAGGKDVTREVVQRFRAHGALPASEE
jgi:hypothetical protein